MDVSARIKKLNNRLKDIDYHRALPWHFEGVNILDIPEYEYLKNEPIAIRKAYSIKYVAENLPITIYDDELIVGVPNQSSVEFGTCIPEYLTKAERECFGGLNEYSLMGHHAPAWNRIIEKGTTGLREDILCSIKSLSPEDKEYNEKLVELKAMEISLDALEIFADRYAMKLSDESDCCRDIIRKHELLKMSEILKKVPRNPAESFWESLESFWITYVLLASNGEFLPLGRLDQHFIKYYQNDIANNKLTKEHATDLIASFLIKCNERNVIDSTLLCGKEDNGKNNKCSAHGRIYERYYHDDEPEDSDNNKFFGQEANNRMMTTVVGGYLPNGTDGTNELSYLFLEVQDRLDLLMPTFGVRINEKTPPEFLRFVADILRHGQGEPVIYNDEAIITNHKRLRVAKEDIYKYSSDGCWEVIFPGLDNFSYSIVFVLQCLEWTFTQGKRVKTGSHDGFATKELEEINSYEDFYKEFLKQVEYQMKVISRIFVEDNGISSIVAPDPLLSALCEDCIEAGKDFLGKGARYQHRMILMTGFADVVDSLTAVKQIVFDEKRISLQELKEAILNNWMGYEELRQFVIDNVPKYGNNDDYADEIAVKFINDYSDLLTIIQKENGHMVFTGGIGTFHMYARWGNDTAATPNGRRAYEPVAPNYSPVPGTNISGPLATIISSTKADLSNFMTGTPVDLQINAVDFDGDDGLTRLTDMIKGFCELKGQIMTISAYSVEQLKEAKLHPEKYKDLRVRMGGLSAYFVQLTPVAQDKIIERFVNC